MATTQENLELLTRTSGVELLSALAAKIGEVNQSIGELTAAYARGELQEKEYEQAAKRVVDSYRDLTEGASDAAIALSLGSGAARDLSDGPLGPSQRQADEHISKSVAEFKPRIRAPIEAVDVEAIDKGRPPEEAREPIRRRATEAIGADGVDRAMARATADQIADVLIRDLKVRLGTGAADQPVGGAEGVKPAAQEVQSSGYKEGLTKQAFSQSRFYTGQQSTPEQARDVANESFKLQEQGLNANQATLIAMREGLQAMRVLTNRIVQQQAAANQLGAGFRQVAGHVAEHQPSALNFGAGN
jgi:hypothetical protein